MGQQRKIFYGWWVLAALFVVDMLAPMGRYVITVFAPFVKEEMRWGATSIGLALSICLWAYALASIPVGWAIDRVGSRRIIFLGAIILTVGLWELSRVHSLWQLFITSGLIVGIGVSMTHFPAILPTTRKWFVQRAGLAGGIVSVASYIGMSIVSPLLTGLASSLSWRTTCFIYALCAGTIIMLLAILVIRSTPESMGLHPDGRAPSETSHSADPLIKEATWTVKEAASTRSFWMIFLGYSLMGIPSQALMGHLVLWGVELGIPKGTAGVLLPMFMLPSVMTTIFGGWLADRFGKRRILTIAFGISALLLMTAGIVIRSPRSLIVLTGLFGLAWGFACGPGLWMAYVGDVFGRASAGGLFGILTFGFGFIGGLGPVIWGRIHDVTGAYNLACLVSAFCLLITATSIMLAKPVVKSQST